MSPDGLPLLGAALAGVAAGLVNALAGGGSLISFPALTVLGLPPLVANLTNTVALTPGYLGAAWAQRRDLLGQGGRGRLLAPLAVVGGVVGAKLLLRSDERLFLALVPWLILLGSGLVALQNWIRGWLAAFSPGRTEGPPLLAGALVAVAAIYGGYFGAGLSVILLGVLAITLDDSLTRLSGLKQLLALAANLSASLVFVGSGRVAWSWAFALALGALAGGALGGGLASRVKGEVLRWLVAAGGAGVGLWFLWR
ncbi:MAG: sulfite exporter TauE/SafE family protein [Cyanobacteriota bacterium]|nr:sulfite exporter TauE/SafE family protein [Cyanobacteriota bacterium]